MNYIRSCLELIAKSIKLIHVILKSGCQWRMLPRDFPKRESVYFYFKIWTNKPKPETDSLLEVILKKLVGLIRTKEGRQEMSCYIAL